MIPRMRWGRTAALLSLLATAPATAQTPTNDADRFNGTWEWRQGSMELGGPEASAELKIWALDERRLQLEFLGLWAYKTDPHPTANSGTASGVALMDAGTVKFRSENEERDCIFILRLRLHGSRMVVSQSGDPCFGFNVTAAGTYRRVSTDRPIFEVSEAPDAEPPE